MAKQGSDLKKGYYYPGCADLSLDMQTRIGYHYANSHKGISVPIFDTESDFKLEGLTTATTINVHAEIPVSQEFVTIFNMVNREEKEALIAKISSLYNYFLGSRSLLGSKFETGIFALIWLPNGDMGIGINLHLMKRDDLSEEQERETIKSFVRNAKILFSIGVDNDDGRKKLE